MSGKVDFWRVEDEHGHGPYNTGPGENFFDEWVKVRMGHQPVMTFQSRPSDIFGFRTIKQARAWFSPEEMELFKKHGYKLKRYQVPEEEVRGDSVQAVVNRHIWKQASGAGHWVTINGNRVFMED
jgi:hypothetical protein